jgi:hypothetical protein
VGFETAPQSAWCHGEGVINPELILPLIEELEDVGIDLISSRTRAGLAYVCGVTRVPEIAELLHTRGWLVLEEEGDILVWKLIGPYAEG